MIDFLSAIWNGQSGFGEIRLMQGARVSQRFYPLPVTLDDVQTLAFDATDRDVYFGVLARTYREGTARACSPNTPVLWADIDAKTFPSKADALATISRMLAYPQIVVDSGHGYHCYWLLQQAIPFDEAQFKMKVIERELGADHCSDAPRIIRIPGTLNHKDDPPTPVRLVRFDVTKRYRAADFATYHEPEKRYMRATVDSRLSKRDLPEWLLDMILHGAPKGQRSDAAFKVALWMTRYGYSADEVRQMFEASPNGIGAKLYEQGDRWLGYVIRAAESAA